MLRKVLTIPLLMLTVDLNFNIKQVTLSSMLIIYSSHESHEFILLGTMIRAHKVAKPCACTATFHRLVLISCELNVSIVSLPFMAAQESSICFFSHNRFLMFS